MTIFDIPADGAFFALLIAIAIAGVVRGFSGFGTGMIVGPVGAMVYSPQTAIVTILVIDTLPMIPLLVAAFRKVSLRELVPVVAGYALLMPVGLWFLKNGDVVVLRWFMSAVILFAAAVLWSGWYYKGPRNAAVRLGVGGMSGFLGGSTAVSGPPVILYWMALRNGAGFVRANLLVFFFVATLFSGVGLYVSGIMTRDALVIGALAAPVYLLGLTLGARLFGFATEKTYRHIALTIVICAAILTLPLLDALRG